MDYHILEIDGFELNSGKHLNIQLSYQVFGKPLHSAPVVLVNHSLTGNSTVTGEFGWWKELIGINKTINTDFYTVLAFNVPGNGFTGFEESFVEDYKAFSAKDVARLFSFGLETLGLNRLFAVIGGSVGGGLVWEMAILRPDLAKYWIPIAADWKATDWLIANCFIQDQILNHSSTPVEDARIHAMTFYRTPESLTAKFNRAARDGEYQVESWLNHHGKKLSDRFKLSAYKMMNHILKTVEAAKSNEEFLEMAKNIKGHIQIITIDSDLLFKSSENWETYVELKTVKEAVGIGEIKSIHGHDAFLLEQDQLDRMLSPIFKQNKQKNDTYKPSYIRNW